MRYIKLLLIGLFVFLAACQGAVAEQVERDMYAAVIVNSVFTCILDNPSLNFGYVEVGKPAELNPSAYYNSVVCHSNKGKTWYLNLSVMGDVAGANNTVAPEAIKCRVFRSTGDGTPVEGWLSLSKEPKALYTSGPNDIAGGEVTLYLQYKLELPEDALSDYYRANVLFAMTDEMQ